MFELSRLGSRHGVDDQPERAADAADSRHDERAAACAAGSRWRNTNNRVGAQARALAVATACLALVSAETSAARDAVDPVGTWSCVVWGHPEFGDERVLLNFDRPRRRAIGAHRERGRPGVERPDAVDHGRSRRCGSAIRGPDGSTRRICAATISAARWRTLTATGGWWCAVSDVEVVPETNEERAAALAAGSAARDRDAALPDRSDSRSEARASRDVLPRRRDGCDRRAGDHRALATRCFASRS